MRLETGYCSWFAGLTNHVDSLAHKEQGEENLLRDFCCRAHLAHADGDRDALEVLVKRHQNPRVHGRRKEIQHPMVSVEDD